MYCKAYDKSYPAMNPVLLSKTHKNPFIVNTTHLDTYFSDIFIQDVSLIEKIQPCEDSDKLPTLFLNLPMHLPRTIVEFPWLCQLMP